MDISPHMNISAIMSSPAVVVRAQQSIRMAHDTMQQHGFHHLPVLSAAGHVVGMVNDRDCEIILQLPAHSNDMLVSEVMRPVVVLVEPHMSASRAARLMLDYHLSCLPVMVEETLVGVVTTSDMLRAFEQIADVVS